MKQKHFEIFLEALYASTELIQERYFRLPIAYGEGSIYRERVYCYELYHQLRKMLPDDFPYILSGEVDKGGHPIIYEQCGRVIPDFLVHNPGHMGPDDNLVIMEVKSIDKVNYRREGEGFLKDIDTIDKMTSIDNGYFKGILLVYGTNYEESKHDLFKIYRERCNPENVLLLFHDSLNERAYQV